MLAQIIAGFLAIDPTFDDHNVQTARKERVGQRGRSSPRGVPGFHLVEPIALSCHTID